MTPVVTVGDDLRERIVLDLFEFFLALFKALDPVKNILSARREKSGRAGDGNARYPARVRLSRYCVRESVRELFVKGQPDRLDRRGAGETEQGLVGYSVEVEVFKSETADRVRQIRCLRCHRSSKMN